MKNFIQKPVSVLWLLPLLMLGGCFSDVKVTIPQYIEPHPDPTTTATIKGGWGVTISGIDGREVQRQLTRIPGMDENTVIVEAGKHVIVAEKFYKRSGIKINTGINNIPNTPTGEHASSNFYKFELEVVAGHKYELNPANVLHGGFVVRDLTLKTETDMSKLDPISKTN